MTEKRVRTVGPRPFTIIPQEAGGHKVCTRCHDGTRAVVHCEHCGGTFCAEHLADHDCALAAEVKAMEDLKAKWASSKTEPHRLVELSPSAQFFPIQPPTGRLTYVDGYGRAHDLAGDHFHMASLPESERYLLRQLLGWLMDRFTLQEQKIKDTQADKVQGVK